MNGENIMVVPEGELNFENGRRGGLLLLSAESCRAVKIDHGRSFMKSYRDLQSILDDICNQIRCMKFNVEKYSNALNQMISDLSA